MARPRKHAPGEEPSAKERLRKSKEKLLEAGGKMLNIRLSPEANQALVKIMEQEGFKSTTEAVNQTLIDRSKK